MASCETCNNCQGCNTCEGCNRCQSCNTCQGCQKCENDCNSKQSWCAIRNDVLASLCTNTFSFNPCIETGKMMGPNPGQFNKASWDAICEWIDQRKNWGIIVSGGDSFPNSTKDAVAPFTANEFNRVAMELGLPGNKKRLELIKGSYFKELESAAKTYKINGLACEKCNTNCDNGCNKCQKCNTGCQGCDSCETNCNRGNAKDPSYCDDEKSK